MKGHEVDKYTWYEVSMSDWDTLSEGAREIFISKSGIAFACRGDLLRDYPNVKTIRKINN